MHQDRVRLRDRDCNVGEKSVRVDIVQSRRRGRWRRQRRRRWSWRRGIIGCGDGVRSGRFAYVSTDHFAKLSNEYSD